MLPDPGAPFGLRGSDVIPLLAGGGRFSRFSSSIGFGSCGRESGDILSLLSQPLSQPSRAKEERTDRRVIPKFGDGSRRQSSGGLEAATAPKSWHQRIDAS